MKLQKRILYYLLALVMVFTLVPAMPVTAQAATNNDTIVVGYSPFNGQFSPFFSQTAYDQDVWEMTQVRLLPSDRAGMVLLNSRNGQTVSYNGKSYTYNGIADCKITENTNGTVYYDFTLRTDVKFSDGKPLTVDDVIFSMYVLADPTYNGTFLNDLPIKGLEDYRAGMTTMVRYLVDIAGEGNHDTSVVSNTTANTFWRKYHACSRALAQEIVDYCMENYADYGAVDVASSAKLWGFWVEDGATIEDFAAVLERTYGSDVPGMVSKESVNSSITDLFPDFDNYNVSVTYGPSAANISGIVKTGTNTLRVILTEVNAKALYSLAIPVVPMHYYGETSKYDYANNKFGFTKGDLSHVRSLTGKPMGAGPYKFVSYTNGVVRFERNSNYFLGTPKTRYINFVETMYDDQKLNGIINGTIDIADPSFSVSTVNAIKNSNSNGKLTGNKITTATVDNLGYGYIGQNAINVSVGGNPGSTASKNLRKAFATVFAVYRDAAIDSYYGDRADVIEYPISETSWAAPKPSEAGYRRAFSKDVNGKEIYTASMTAQQRYDAALQAALGYFKAAGYTVSNGKLTAAPDGARLEYVFWLPGDGRGDHPAFMIANGAANALKSIGMNLYIYDLTNSSDLWNNLDAINVDMWAAAWGSTIDPDMTQIYFSDVANGPTTQEGMNPIGGPNQGGSNYEYCIADATLDAKIKAALATTNQSTRKSIYKQCLDIVMDWAVEIPTYQRQSVVLFSSQRLDTSKLVKDTTTFYGWMNEIHTIVKTGTPVPPSITGQPKSVTQAVNTTARFTVTAGGSGLTYQWQFKSPTGSWTNCTLATADSDTLLVPVTAARNKYQYRCKVTGANGTTLISSAVTLTVNTTITGQPKSVTQAVGTTAKFTVTATGVGLTYRWQFKTPTGSWTNTTLTGAKTATLSVPVKAARNGNQYRCQVTSANGVTKTSNAATLTVGSPAPTITAQPKSYTGKIGTTATFKVAASGAGLTYQWQFKSPTGSWNTCTLTSAKTATLSVPVTAARNKYQYRCKVTASGGASTVSSAATLTVNTVITGQPKSLTQSVGTTAKFTVAASGAGLTYQWQFKTPTGSWTNTTLTSAKTATLSVPVTAARNKYQYRCKVTSANGVTLTSTAATLTVNTKITGQPKSLTQSVGTTAKFTVTATGAGLTYQWQFNNGSGWQNCTLTGAKTATLSVSVTAARNGYQYRCKITSANGVTVISSAATLTVK